MPKTKVESIDFMTKSLERAYSALLDVQSELEFLGDIRNAEKCEEAAEHVDALMNGVADRIELN